MAAKKKGTSRRKKVATKKSVSSPADDWITIRYGTLIYYILVGLIIGLAISALLLMWVAQNQSDHVVVDSAVQSQLLPGRTLPR